MTFIGYSKCSTCKKAQKYLEERNIPFEIREIKEETPTIEELKSWINLYDIPIQKFFNTSGILYRELGLKERLKDLDEDETLKLFSSNGMLIKRPLLITEDRVLIGFKEKEWTSYFDKITLPSA